MWRASVPFLAKVRRCLALCPDDEVLYYRPSNISAIYFSEAIRALSDVAGPFDISELAGFSYQELFRHCLDMQGKNSNILSRMDAVLYQFPVIDALLDLSTSQHCMDALVSEKVVSWLARIAGVCLYGTEGSSTAPEGLSPLVLIEQVHTMIVLCAKVIKLTSERGMVGSSTEMLDVGFVFLAERFFTTAAAMEDISSTSFKLLVQHLPCSESEIAKLLDIMKRCTFRWIGALDLVEDQAVRQRATQQIRTIYSRALVKDDTKVWVLELWRNLHIETSSPPVMADVCGATGCKSLDPPKLQCQRCGSQSYCDKFCQKR